MNKATIKQNELIEGLSKRIEEMETNHTVLGKRVEEMESIVIKQVKVPDNTTHDSKQWIILAPITANKQKDANKNYHIEKQRLETEGVLYWNAPKEADPQIGYKFCFLLKDVMEMYEIVEFSEAPGHWNTPERVSFKVIPLKLSQWSFTEYKRVNNYPENYFLIGTKKRRWLDPFSQ